MTREQLTSFLKERQDSIEISMPPGLPGLNLKSRKTPTCYFFPFTLLLDPATQPSEIDELMSNAREPIVVNTITRVVGYYSRTSNWNKSKLAELEDRRKGNYVI